MIFTRYTNTPSEELIACPVSTELEQELVSRLEHSIDLEEEAADLRDDVITLRQHLRWALQFVVRPENVGAEEFEQHLESAQWHV